MKPDRRKFVGGHKIEEFWWGGKWVVYIDHHATEMTFEEAVRHYEKEGEPDGQ